MNPQKSICAKHFSLLPHGRCHTMAMTESIFVFDTHTVFHLNRNSIMLRVGNFVYALPLERDLRNKSKTWVLLHGRFLRHSDRLECSRCVWWEKRSRILCYSEFYFRISFTLHWTTKKNIHHIEMPSAISSFQTIVLKLNDFFFLHQ